MRDSHGSVDGVSQPDQSGQPVHTTAQASRCWLASGGGPRQAGIHVDAMVILASCDARTACAAASQTLGR